MTQRIPIKDIVNNKDNSVTLAGWVNTRRDHGKLIFLDLRDRTGIVQLVISQKNNPELYKSAQDIKDEWVIEVSGMVKERPDNMKNPQLETGLFEIPVAQLKILSKAETLPFSVNTDGYDISEDLRLKYRYLDLRRPRMVELLKIKDAYKAEISSFLRKKGFMHIDTPILTKSTPEGARDFLVPSRNYPSKFYALPQSPQQYKQLLMVAVVEKYFQFARCFRDEDLRQDRQPEFTQLDIEMSFVDEHDILSLVEELFTSLVRAFYSEKRVAQHPFPRLAHSEAMSRYNSDKPDLRVKKDDANELAFLFVRDFPMFEWKESEKRWDAAHHPFTKIKNKSADWRP